MEPQTPPPPPDTTANPLVNVGRKVKSALRTHQEPSVRIARRARPHTEQPILNAGTVDRESNEKASKSGISSSIKSLFGREDLPRNDGTYGDEYDTDTVDILDVVDPEVSTLSTLTNVQNSLFVPQLGGIVNRRATYHLDESPEEERRIDRLKTSFKEVKTAALDKLKKVVSPEVLERRDSITSQIKDTHFAVLPHGVALDGWSTEDKEELDDMVRHMLHSRRSKFKRSMKGFYKYVRRPLGLFVTIYATLITLFGAAWVLFLIGWISLGSKKDYIINIVDNVLVALFAIIGDGLAPFRAVDTYHMIYIAKYHRKTWKQRERMGLPELVDHNDLPNQSREEANEKEHDIESLVARKMPRRLARKVAPRIPKKLEQRIVTRSHAGKPSYEYTVLTEEEQAKLEHHERKFSKSHTFYKPHETETHYAFPLKLLVAIVILLDLHSCLQITLGVCTWSMEDSRPFALTTVILCCSIACNITGGVLISVGDKRTRKKDVLERMMRQELTSEAITELETRWLKAAEERGEIDPRVRKRREETKEAEENEQLKQEWKAVPSLPKKLLGKGEDHRQPSLPQHEKRSNSNPDPKSKKAAAGDKHGRKKSDKPLNSVLEQPAVGPAGSEKESRGQRALRLIRRADLDKS